MLKPSLAAVCALGSSRRVWSRYRPRRSQDERVVIIGITAFPRIVKKSYHEPEEFSVASWHPGKILIRLLRFGFGKPWNDEKRTVWLLHTKREC